MTKINFIIIDDEPLARQIIRTYAANLDWMNCIGEFGSAGEAFAVITLEECQMAFIDINMPKISGLELIKSLKNPPEFIITTAYREYAVDAFEINAADYLVKPFSFDRFLQAVSKVYQKIIPAATEKSEKDFVVVKTDNKFLKIDFSNILYIEAYKEYIKIHTTEKTVISSVSMKSISDSLSKEQFYRIHRSYIISIQYLDYIQGYEVILKNKTKLPLSRDAKDDFINFLQNL